VTDLANEIVGKPHHM